MTALYLTTDKHRDTDFLKKINEEREIAQAIMLLSAGRCGPFDDGSLKPPHTRDLHILFLQNVTGMLHTCQVISFLKSP